MKRIILIIFLATTMQAQSWLLTMGSNPRNVSTWYSLDLDGSTEYASKTSPSGLDLNSANYLSGDNTTFTTTVGDWVDNGDVSSSIASNKMQVVATGTISSDYISLPQTAFSTTFVHEHNYTVQAGVKSDGVLGSDLVVNGSFSSNSDWGTLGGSSTISGGVLNANVTAYQVAAAQFITGLTTGDNANVTLDVTVTSGTLRVRFGTTIYETVTSSNSYSVNCSSIPSNQLNVQGSPDFVGTIDNIVVKKRTYSSIKIGCGNSLSSALTTTGTEATKAYTFTYDSTGYGATGNPIKIFPQANDTYTLDNIDISEAYDLSIEGWFKTTDDGALITIISQFTGTNATTGLGWYLYKAADNKLLFGHAVQDAVVHRSISNAVVNDGAWHKYIVSITRTSQSLSLDGTLQTGGVAETYSYKKYNSEQPLTIGRYSNGVFSYWLDNLGKITITRTNGLGEVTGTSIYDWSGDASTFLKDKGTLGNHLTGTNITTDDVNSWTSNYTEAK